MEEFLFVLDDLGAGEFDLDVAYQRYTAVQLDRHIIVYSLQIGQLVRMNLRAAWENFLLVAFDNELADCEIVYLWPASDDRISERSKCSNRRKIVQFYFANLTSEREKKKRISFWGCQKWFVFGEGRRGEAGLPDSVRWCRFVNSRAAVFLSFFALQPWQRLGGTRTTNSATNFRTLTCSRWPCSRILFFRCSGTHVHCDSRVMLVEFQQIRIVFDVAALGWYGDSLLVSCSFLSVEVECIGGSLKLSAVQQIATNHSALKWRCEIK